MCIYVVEYTTEYRQCDQRTYYCREPIKSTPRDFSHGVRRQIVVCRFTEVIAGPYHKRTVIDVQCIECWLYFCSYHCFSFEFEREGTDVFGLATPDSYAD